MYVKSLAEEVDGHFNNDVWPTYQALKKLGLVLPHGWVLSKKMAAAWSSQPLFCRQLMLIHPLMKPQVPLLTNSMRLWQGWRTDRHLVFQISIWSWSKSEVKPWCLGSMLPWLPFGNLVLFLLNGKEGWSSLPKMGKGTVRIAIAFAMSHCSVLQAMCLLIYCLYEFAVFCWRCWDQSSHSSRQVS